MNALSLKLRKIDPLHFGEHGSLAAHDICYHLGEYTAHCGYSYSDTNQLIINIKKKPHTSSQNELYYKEVAITQAANRFRATLNAESNRHLLQSATLVPVPPSAIHGDPRYDDRMIRMLHQLGNGLHLDIRELVRQHASVEPTHASQDRRPTVAEIIENYYVVENHCEPEPSLIWLFDDVLTGGNHFKAMQYVLRQRFPDVEVHGFFVARRALPQVEPGAEFDLEDPA